MFHYMENIVLTDGLPQTGFARLQQILAPEGPLPFGKSTWWRGVKTGRFPKPVKLGPNTTAWKVQDIRELIDRLATNDEPPPPSSLPISERGHA